MSYFQEERNIRDHFETETSKMRNMSTRNICVSLLDWKEAILIMNPTPGKCFGLLTYMIGSLAFVLDMIESFSKNLDNMSQPNWVLYWKIRIIHFFPQWLCFRVLSPDL